MSFSTHEMNSDAALPLDPEGPFPCPVQVPAGLGGGETPLSRSESGAITDRRNGDNPAEPWTDLGMEVFFLGSLGMNVSTDALTKLQLSHPCGPTGGWFVNRRKRTQWPARCKKLTCSHCLPKEAAIRQLILSESMPDTMWSQTMVCSSDVLNPWETIRYKMNLFFGYYRRKAPLREMSYVVEMNPQKTGYHIHALCHGPAWKIPHLVAAQAAAGIGEHGNKWNRIGKSHDAAGYGLKGFRAAGYGLKGYGEADLAAEALRINGGRLEHHTRGFIRVNGKPATIAEARKAVMLKKYGPLDPDTHFKLAPVGSAYFSVVETDEVKYAPQRLLDDL